MASDDFSVDSGPANPPAEAGTFPSGWLAPPVLLVLLALLLLACYWPMFVATTGWVIAGEDMAHGLFAPFVSLFVAWQHREQVLHPTSPASKWSIAFLLFAAILGAAATLANSTTFSRFAFLISLCGCLLLLGGAPALKKFAFPVAILLFTFPIPPVLYGEVTLPLQLLATRLSEIALELLGFSVYRDGNILQLAHMQLNVVEACSGLRSLITLTFFCLVYAYFFETSKWVRLAVTLCAIPAAIFVNTLRITTTGILGKYAPELTKGTWHSLLGWSGFFVGFGLVLLVHHLVLARFSRTEFWRREGRE